MIPQNKVVVNIIKDNFLKISEKVLTFALLGAIMYKQCGSPQRSQYAGMAELADARDLKSREINFSYRFDPGFRHQYRGVEQSGSSSGS